MWCVTYARQEPVCVCDTKEQAENIRNNSHSEAYIFGITHITDKYETVETLLLSTNIKNNEITFSSETMKRLWPYETIGEACYPLVEADCLEKTRGSILFLRSWGTDLEQVRALHEGLMVKHGSSLP